MQVGDKWYGEDGAEYTITNIERKEDGSILAFESICTSVVIPS